MEKLQCAIDEPTTLTRSYCMKRAAYPCHTLYPNSHNAILVLDVPVLEKPSPMTCIGTSRFLPRLSIHVVFFFIQGQDTNSGIPISVT